MITLTPHDDYDCIYVELEDAESRVRLHIHADRIAKSQVRQIAVDSTSGPIYAYDGEYDRLDCDPHYPERPDF